jgi:hypothetical protein
LKYGAAHTEFIKNSEDGEIYFLETSSRVGGASGNGRGCFKHQPWKEWAAIEDALVKGKIQLAKSKSLRWNSFDAI